MSLRACPGLHPETMEPLRAGLQGIPPPQATTLGPSEPLSSPCNPRRDSEEGTDAHPHPQGPGRSPSWLPDAATWRPARWSQRSGRSGRTV